MADDEEWKKLVKEEQERRRKKVRLIKGTRKETYMPPAVCRMPPPMPAMPRRLLTKPFGLETDNYHVCVMERSDGLVRVILKPKKKGLTHSVVSLDDGFGQSLIMQACPVGEMPSVAWRAHEPFEQVNTESFSDDEKKGE